MTRVMNLCGAALPKTLLGQNDGNQRGHWESQAIIDAHNEMLSALGSQWSDWRPLDLDARKSTRARIVGDMADMISVEYKGAETVVIKEPRICRFTPAYLDAVQSVGAAVHVIIPIRNPLEVAASLSKRDGFSLQRGLFLWLSHMIGAEQGSRGQSRAFVDYPSFLAQPAAETARITADMPFALPFSVKQARAQIEDYVEPSLKRETSRAEDVAQHPLCAGWINDVYQALLILTLTPNAPEATAIIDRVSTEFNGASDILWAMQTESDLKSKAYEQALADSDAALSAMNADHQTAWAAAQAQREGEIAALNEKFETRITALNVTLADQDSQLKALEAVIAEQKAQLSDEKERVLALSNANEAGLARETQLKTTLEARQRDITTQKSKRETLQAAIVSQKQQHDDAITSLRTEFDATQNRLETQIASLKQQITASEQTIATLISERDFMQDEFGALLSSVETNLDTAHHELWRARAEKGAVEQSLNDVLSSTSWRFTRGFRGVMNRLRGRGAVKAISAPNPVARITHNDGHDG